MSKAIFVVTFFIASVAFAQDAKPVSKLRMYAAQYIGCYDADSCTFNLHLGMNIVLTNQKFRLCDINAPEIRPLDTRVEATKSRDALLSWIAAAKSVKLLVPQKKYCDLYQGDTICSKTGKYGRWLVYIMADGVNLNQKLLDEGLAVPYIKCR